MSMRPAPALGRLPASRVLRIRDMVVGLLALAALVAMIAGVPWVLMTIAPIGLPHSLPAWDTVLAYATRPDDGTLFLGALTIIAWTGWAAFTLSTLLEALARARGIGSIRLPILALPQHAAAALVAAVAMAVPSAGTTALRLADHPTIVATAPRTVGTLDATYASDASPTLATTSTSTSTSTDRPTVVVHRHDTLWGLAEHHLGDGRRYVEIAQLNYGRPQSDGASLDDSHWLHPGWVLRLPTDAEMVGERTRPNLVVVRHGDTLWEIARDHLGDPESYREIFDLNWAAPVRRWPFGDPRPDPSRMAPRGPASLLDPDSRTVTRTSAAGASTDAARGSDADVALGSAHHATRQRLRACRREQGRGC